MTDNLIIIGTIQSILLVGVIGWYIYRFQYHRRRIRRQIRREKIQRLVDVLAHRCANMVGAK